MTVAELKALAKKKKVSLNGKGTKADIITVLLSSEASIEPAKRPAMKNAVTAVKTAAVKQLATKKAVLTAKTAADKQPTTKSAAPAAKAAAVRKPVSSQRRSFATKAPKVTIPAREWKLPPAAEEPVMAQERVAEAKYYTGPALQVQVPPHGELPQGYGDDKIVLMMRDPFVAYAYWEATAARIEREKQWFGWNSKLCVRIYDITGVQFDGRNAIGYYDQEIVDRIGNWYFDLGRPAHSFCADLGLLSPEGRFLTFARSNYITMPLDGASDIIDEEWMLVDEEFWKLYGYPEGFRRGVSSPEMQEMLKRRRELEITSPGLFSRERPTKRKQKS